MSYTPPLGSSADLSFQDAPAYTPPGGSAADLSFSTGAIPTPLSGDLFWDSVYVALHMDDAGLTCEKGTPFTLTGGVARSAAQSKFGGYSAYFDGVDDEIRNSSDLPDLMESSNCGQFFCRPVAQSSTNPCVFQFRHWRLEYKPDGYHYGFVMNSEGVRTPCGVHPEDEWHYIWYTVESYALRLYINGQFIAEFVTGYYYDGSYFTIGSASLSTNPDTAFAGYVDDLLMTRGPSEPINGSYLRTDPSVPIWAFYDRAPDPEGAVVGSLSIVGTVEGIVAPIGPVAHALSIAGTATGYIAPIGVGIGRLKLTGYGVASIPQAGRVVGKIKFTGLGAGVVGVTGTGLGHLAFTGHGSGSRGSFGSASGRMRITGAAIGKHGASGSVDGSLRFDALAIGTTPIVPIGPAFGSLRFSGNAYGSGGATASHCH